MSCITPRRILPTFNLAVNIWRGPVMIPPIGPPAIVTIGQLTPGDRVFIIPQSAGGGAGNYNADYLLLPKATDIRFITAITPADFIEVPAGSAMYYSVIWVSDWARGFSNEYRIAGLTKLGPWPFPMP